MKKSLVKQDQSFLEFPLWVMDGRLDPMQCFTIQNDFGTYTLTCGKRPPDAVDALFIYAFLRIAQTNGSRDFTIKNRSEVLRMCGLPANKRNYDRLIESCRRWKHVNIEFDGCYFDGNDKKHKVLSFFNILNKAEYNREKKNLYLRFSDDFYQIIEETKLYRYIDLNYYRMLKRPVSRRLYEILKKHLECNNEWKCEAVKLAQKLTLKEKYPSQILKKLKPAVNEITGSDLKTEMDHYKNDDGKTITVFRRIDKVTPKPKNKGKPDPLKPLSGKIGKKVRQKKTITKAETERRKKELLKQLNESGI